MLMEVRMRSKSHNLMEASTGRLSDGWIRVLLLLREACATPYGAGEGDTEYGEAILRRAANRVAMEISNK